MITETREKCRQYHVWLARPNGVAEMVLYRYSTPAGSPRSAIFADGQLVAESSRMEEWQMRKWWNHLGVRRYGKKKSREAKTAEDPKE